MDPRPVLVLHLTAKGPMIGPRDSPTFCRLSRGTDWYLMVPSSTEWYQVVLNGTKWYQVVLIHTLKEDKNKLGLNWANINSSWALTELTLCKL